MASSSHEYETLRPLQQVDSPAILSGWADLDDHMTVAETQIANALRKDGNVLTSAGNLVLTTASQTALEVTLTTMGTDLSVDVWAWGSCELAWDGGVANGVAHVEISLDNGSTWTAGQPCGGVIRDGFDQMPLSPHWYRRGTPTGNVKARLRVGQSTGVNGDLHTKSHSLTIQARAT